MRAEEGGSQAGTKQISLLTFPAHCMLIDPSQLCCVNAGGVHFLTPLLASLSIPGMVLERCVISTAREGCAVKLLLFQLYLMQNGVMLAMSIW